VTERLCRTCAAYQPTNATQGTCRAKPPVAVPQMTRNPIKQKPELSLMGGWPPVAPDEWCLGWSFSHEYSARSH